MIPNFEIHDDAPIQVGDPVIQFGEGTRSVWRTGSVLSIDEGKAKVKFIVASDGTSWSDIPPITLRLAELKKIAA